MPGTAPLVMPELIPDPIERIREFDRRHQRFGQVIELEPGLGELLVVEIEQAVVLNVEIVDPLLLVTIDADGLHVLAPGLPVHLRTRQPHLLVAHLRTNRSAPSPARSAERRNSSRGWRRGCGTTTKACTMWWRHPVRAPQGPSRCRRSSCTSGGCWPRRQRPSCRCSPRPSRSGPIMQRRASRSPRPTLGRSNTAGRSRPSRRSAKRRP